MLEDFRANVLKQAKGLPRDFHTIVCNALGGYENTSIARR